MIVALGGAPPKTSRRTLPRAADRARVLRRIWADLADEKQSVDWWERSGRTLKSELDEHGERWLELARDWREKLPGQSEEQYQRHVSKVEELGADALISRIFPSLVATLGNPGLTNPSLRDRMNAWLRVFAHRLGQTGRGAETATANDAEDLVQLQHVGMPAFFMTHDTDILFDVGQARTFQAPWVRRFVELAEDPLPEGPPWGSSAVAASRSFTARTRAELRALAVREKQFVDRLRSREHMN